MFFCCFMIPIFEWILSISWISMKTKWLLKRSIFNYVSVSNPFQVARSQNGGAWSELDIESVKSDDEDQYNQNGIDRNIKNLIETKFTVGFGAQKPLSTSVLQTNDLTAADNLSKYGPYLCTGYDVYMTDEPCIMCAMALVHSRVRRIFFHRPNVIGALKTLTKLHTIKALNHHYEVYQICWNAKKMYNQAYTCLRYIQQIKYVPSDINLWLSYFFLLLL